MRWMRSSFGRQHLTLKERRMLKVEIEDLSMASDMTELFMGNDVATKRNLFMSMQQMLNLIFKME